MTYVYKWEAVWEEFGEIMKEEEYFSSHAKVKLYSADHADANDWENGYWSDYKKIAVV